jgi:hypothetical protein
MMAKIRNRTIYAQTQAHTGASAAAEIGPSTIELQTQ